MGEIFTKGIFGKTKEQFSHLVLGTVFLEKTKTFQIFILEKQKNIIDILILGTVSRKNNGNISDIYIHRTV